MASTLDDMLTPGETVVWREFRRNRGQQILLGGFFAVLALVFIGFLFVLDDSLFVVGGVVLCLCILVVAVAMMEPDSTETLITNRRLLLRRPPRRDGDMDTVVVLALDRVAKIGLLDSPYELAVEVSTHEGTTEQIGGLRNLSDFLAALNQQAGLPGSFSIGGLGKLSRVQGYLDMAVIPFFMWAGMWLASSPFFDTEGFGLIYFLGLAVGLVLAVAGMLFCSCLLGHATSLIAILLMPRLATAEEAEAWLNSKPMGWLARWSAWRHPLYFKLASWRYGQAIRRRGMGEASHGV